jgi:hypothetical protein
MINGTSALIFYELLQVEKTTQYNDSNIKLFQRLLLGIVLIIL